MILVVGNTKGGVGKTTLAVNLAIARALAGRDVLLVDGDEQGTAIGFTELRTEQLGRPGYTAVSLHGGTAARLGVRRRSRSAGMDRWLTGTSVRSRNRACHYRRRSEPGAAGRRRVATSASAVTCSSGGSPGNWPSLR